MDKRGLALCGLVALFALSGCIGFITGEPLAFESSPALVPNGSTADTGFSLEQYNETNINRSVEVFGVQREIRISLHQAVYVERLPTNVSESDADVSTLANESQLNRSLRPTAVTVVSVPDAQFFGQSVNPLVRLPNDELIERFGSSSKGSVTNLDKQGERTIQMLGSETTLTAFNGTTQSENGSAPSRVSVAKTAHDGDVVIVVAVQPQDDSDDEKLDRFIEALEHPAEAPN